MLKRLLATIAGVALTFSFAPFHFYFLAFLSLAVIAYFWQQESPWQAFITGFFYGFGFFASSTYWVYISIHYFGNTPALIAFFVSFLFIVFLGFLFFAPLGALVSFFLSRNSYAIGLMILFPACWVLGELWRTYILTGFPWLLLGYSQMDTPLRNLAPLFGVYGLSYFTALMAGILLVLANPKSSFFAKYFGIGLLTVVYAAGFSLHSVQWTKPQGSPITVSLIQGNIDQNHKWDTHSLLQILETYKKLTENEWQNTLIIWPEAAIPTFPEDAAEFIDYLNKTAKSHHSNLLFGIPLQNLQTQKYYNGLMVVGENPGEYKKVHLVPFGEYLPLQFLFAWFYHYFQVPMSDAEPGSAHQISLHINDIKIAPFICYEIIYPWRVLSDTLNRQLMVSISDDSWFGDSIALNQHLQMAQMRALETGRYLLLAANTGITGIINPQGKLIKKAPENREFVLSGLIQPMAGKTPLMFWQYYPILALVLLSLLGGLFRVAQTDTDLRD